MSEFFINVVNMSISASYIVLAVLLLRFLLKKAPKWITVLLWGIVAVRLICPFSIESVMSLIPSEETISPGIMMEGTPHINSGIPFLNSVVNPLIGESFAPTPETSVNPLQIWIGVFTAVWLVGVLALLIYTFVSYWRLKRRIGAAVLLCENIYQSESVASPFVFGIIKPKIYLPFNMNVRDIEHVIAHERAHIRRKDHLLKPLGFLILTFHWFNPLVWLGYLLLCRDIELACDEKVIKELDNEKKADYSQALLTCSVNRRMIAACPLAFGEVGVKDRVKLVLNYKKPAFGIIIVAVLASIVVAICFLTNPRTTLNDDLSVFIDMQVAEHNYSEGHTDGNFIVTHHKILDVDETLNKTTVYIWSMYHEYSCENGKIKLEAGSHIPTVITVKRTGSHGHYELVEYWTPGDGSDYAKDIKAKFPWYLHSKALDSQRYVDEQRAFCENAAKEYFSDSSNVNSVNKLTWTYSPMLSYTGHSFFPFEFDFDYTHIIATCNKGMMQDLEADGQPKDSTLRFEKGQHVYWTPEEAVIEKIPDISKVKLTIYNGDNEIYCANIVFKCVARELGSADFDIYIEESDGLILTRKDGVPCLVEKKNSSVSNVGGVDAINDSNPYLPKLYVSYGDSKVRAWTGTASWTFAYDNGMMQSINADSSEPLAVVDHIKPWAINVPNREGNTRLGLEFDVTPDSIKAKGWFFTDNEKNKPFDPILDGMFIKLNESSEPCLYEVVATWDSSDEYFGTIHYAFYVSSYSIEVITVKEIVDRTISENIPTDEAEEPFCIDEDYIYYFPSMRSEYVIVKFNNGDEMTVKHAMSQGLLSIKELDRWKIKYNKKENIGEWEFDNNGNLKWASSFPVDIYHTTLSHFQTLYEQTSTEQIQEKYDNEELIITKMHYYNTKKQWCADGYTYKYRLEITGRMNNAEKNTTYIVLSNTEDITFEQAWKASGFSSLSTDYFKPTEAVIVGHKLFD